jgi:positive phototaxis protein PixI
LDGDFFDEGFPMKEQFLLTSPTALSGFAEPDPVQRSRRGDLQFLAFPLGSETKAMLPVSQLTEVLTVSVGQVVPIPDMPATVLGVYNWRGEILWIADLGKLLGLEPLHQQMRGQTAFKVLVSVSGRRLGGDASRSPLGLAVREVEDMHWCNPGDIESPPGTVVTPELSPFLRGFTLSDNGEILLALDAAAIVDRMLADDS